MLNGTATCGHILSSDMSEALCLSGYIATVQWLRSYRVKTTLPSVLQMLWKTALVLLKGYITGSRRATLGRMEEALQLIGKKFLQRVIKARGLYGQWSRITHCGWFVLLPAPHAAWKQACFWRLNQTEPVTIVVG